MPELPLEIWRTIVLLLHRKDARTCLFTSRFLYRIAARRIFHTITLEFGTWQKLTTAYNQQSRTIHKLDQASLLRSHQIEDHIMSCSRFATAIRRLKILSYGKEDLVEDVFQHLPNIFQHLPDLRAFWWMGHYPSMPVSVASSLVQYCPRINELRIPAIHEAYHFPNVLSGLTNLEVLFLRCEIEIDDTRGYRPKELQKLTDHWEQLINSDGPTLRSLSIFGHFVFVLEPVACTRLTDLDLWGPKDEDLEHLGSLFPYMPQLRSLAFVELNTHGVYTFLYSNSENLPLLRFLKVMSLEARHTNEQMSYLIEFLLSKPDLQRLDLDIPGLGRQATLSLLEVISKKLPKLTALGMDVRTLSELEDLEILAEHLPERLRACHVQLCFENIPLNTPEMEKLFYALATRPLNLIHFQNLFTNAADNVEDLAYVLESATVIGVDHFLCFVDRTGPYPVVHEWSHKDIAFRTVESLGDDGEWVLRYHGLLNSILA